ncbi:uncharacterized protein [Nicotiana sylvestris]|uniref:uncharacterized protein n=1 Tax=Nicotiana sylvestris TaxID=4096 RepID=UPI00388C71B0
MVGEKVLLKVSLVKGVMRFRKKGKLSPRFIGPFEVLRSIGEVAYELALPPSLSCVHPIFHVSMLQEYIGDPSHVLDFITVQSKDMEDMECVARIMDMMRQVAAERQDMMRKVAEQQVVGALAIKGL